MNKEVSYKITILNFMFTIGMVSYHFRWVEPFNIKYINGLDQMLVNLYINFCDCIGFVAMSYFFFASAFLFYYNIDSSKAAFIKMKKRLKTLLIPYLIWNLIVLLYKVIRGEKIILSLKTISFFFFLDPINGPTWYLIALILLMLPSFIIVKLKDKKVFSFILLIFSLLILTLRDLGIVNSIFKFKSCWWYGNMIDYLPTYILGIFLGLNYSDLIIKEKYNRKKAIYVAIFLFIISILLLKFTSIRTLEILSYVFIISGIWLIVRIKNIKSKLNSLLKMSFFIYVMHGPILIPEVNRFYSLMFKDISLPGIAFILLKLFGIVLMIAFCKMLIKILKKTVSDKTLFYLSGGRV